VQRNGRSTDPGTAEARHDGDSAAAIFKPDGDVVGYWEARSQNGNRADGELAMISAAVNSTVRTIEGRSFRKRHRHRCIIALAPVEDRLADVGVLLAVDSFNAWWARCHAAAAGTSQAEVRGDGAAACADRCNGIAATGCANKTQRKIGGRK
jgi:transcriptional regulator of acetoin/glycerol metabolism